MTRFVMMLTLAAAGALAADSAWPVYGRCEVRAEGERDNFGACNLTDIPGGKVPEGMLLTIDQIAVSCMGPLDRQILILALGFHLKPGGEHLTQIVVPLTRREVMTTEKVSRYEALLRVRLYAGGGTSIEPYMSMESGYVPSPRPAVCGVMLHGRLTPVQQ